MRMPGMGRTEVTVTVTEEHILEGLRGNCNRCPVALAVKEALDLAGEYDVAVYPDGGVATHYCGYATPHEVIRFVRLYDSGELVYPFSFRMEMK